MSASAAASVPSNPIEMTKILFDAYKRLSQQKSCYSIFRHYSLGNIFQELEEGYIAHGELSDFHFVVKLGDKVIDLGEVNDPTTDLLPHASPASFGEGFETKYDESVRKCMSISGSQLTKVSQEEARPPKPPKLQRSTEEEKEEGESDHESEGDEWSDEYTEEEEARGYWCYGEQFLDIPDVYKFAPYSEIVARLSKVHIYGPGGFFREHSDTPQGKGHIGTLVVLLPSPHEGGELFLGNELVLEPPEDPQDCAWVAFSPDLPHHVEPVTSGHRVTAQFDLFLNTSRPDNSKGPVFDVFREEGYEDDYDEPASKRQKPDSVPRPRDSQMVIANRLWEQIETNGQTKGPVFGVLLYQRYSWNEPEPTLRGPDEPLVASLRARHPDWRVTFHSVLLSSTAHHGGSEWGSSDEEEEEQGIAVNTIAPFDFEHVINGKSAGSVSGHRQVPVLLTHNNIQGGEILSFAKGGWLGNDAGDVKTTSFYVHTVALIEKPGATS